MEILETSSNELLKKIPKWLPVALLTISFIGFADAVYLTVKHYLGEPLNCSILKGCEIVTASQYATIGNIPVALLGAIYYLIIFLLIVAYLDTKRNSIITFISYFTVIGFLASLWFLYLQIFVIGALCLYCLISATTSTLLFALGIYTFYKIS